MTDHLTPAQKILRHYSKFEDMEKEDVAKLSFNEQLIYELYWVVKCQSSPTWHHVRDKNGCLGCINTIEDVIKRLDGEKENA